MQRFFPEAKELQMIDEKGSYKNMSGEALHDIWCILNQKLKKCPNHGLTFRHLKLVFLYIIEFCDQTSGYGGSFMRKPFPEIVVFIDEVLKKNRAYHTKDAAIGDLRFIFGLLFEHKKERGVMLE